MTRAVWLRSLPRRLAGLGDLALDLRWTWSHAGDELWRRVSPEVWERTQNPWIILQDLPSDHAAAISDGGVYRASVPASRPARDYTPRIVPHHPEARVPMEVAQIQWSR